MKQIIYLGGNEVQEYYGMHRAKVIGDCDWKKGEVKTEGVDYTMGTAGKFYEGGYMNTCAVCGSIFTRADKRQHVCKSCCDKSVIVPIPKKQEGEEWDDAFAAAPGSRFLHPITKEWFKNNFTITRKS